MTLSEKLNYTQQFEDIIFRLANLMLDTMKIALDTLDDYHQLFDENSNQDIADDMAKQKKTAAQTDHRLPRL